LSAVASSLVILAKMLHLVRGRFSLVLLAVLTLAVAACTGKDAIKSGVQTVVTGEITGDARVDSIFGNSPYEVLVFRTTSGGLVDTLGFASTNKQGAFSMAVDAPERGIYTLAITRSDSLLTLADIVVAHEDTATFKAKFPMGNRPLIIRSRENAALIAYMNTRIQYERSIAELVNAGNQNTQELEHSVGRTVSTLWGMREVYPNTLAGELAMAESVVMLEGVDDRLLLDRARMISPENPNYVEVARAARRAQGRLRGLNGSLDILDEFKGKAATDEQRAALDAERVVTYMDAGLPEQTLQYARILTQAYPKSEWATWASRIIYDAEHLMPGMKAPSFTVMTIQGETVSLDSLRGKYVLVEFYAPQQREFLEEIPLRSALVNAAEDQDFEIISISLEGDPRINQAFLENVDFPGTLAVAPGGLQSRVASWYNVRALPKRILIDRQGNIVSNYEGPYLRAIIQEISALFASEEQRG